jgi:hypothetical protein
MSNYQRVHQFSAALEKQGLHCEEAHAHAEAGFVNLFEMRLVTAFSMNFLCFISSAEQSGGSLFISVWWFGTFFFPYIGNNNPNRLSYFQRGRSTTN